MTITLPDDPALSAMGEGQILLNWACGAYGAGPVSSFVAAQMEGLEFRPFDEELYERRISCFTEEASAQGQKTLSALGLR